VRSPDQEVRTVTTYATAYGGTVIKFAFKDLNPKPATIEGVNNDKLENGGDTPK
jgi:hypothetical protein